MAYFRVNERCNGCLACVENCPADALSAQDDGTHRSLLHNMARCARCGNCWRICPREAIEFQHLLRGDWDTVATMDLIRCEVCNVPVFTVPFEKTVSGRLKRDVEARCPNHRSSGERWAHAVFATDRKPGGGGLS